MPYPVPHTEREWAEDFLEFIGADPTPGQTTISPTDPRVEGLAAWESAEGTFGEGNTYNPLDLEQLPSSPYPGQSHENLGYGPGLWNPQGVVMFSDFASGARAWENQLQQPIDQPTYEALIHPSSTQQFLDAIASSDYAGGGGGSPQEVAYAQDIGSLMGSASANLVVTTSPATQASLTATTGGLGGLADTIAKDTLAAGRNWIEMLGGAALVVLGALMVWNDLKGTQVGAAVNKGVGAVKSAAGIALAGETGGASLAMTQQAKSQQQTYRTEQARAAAERAQHNAAAASARRAAAERRAIEGRKRPTHKDTGRSTGEENYPGRRVPAGKMRLASGEVVDVEEF